MPYLKACNMYISVVPLVTHINLKQINQAVK